MLKRHHLLCILLITLLASRAYAQKEGRQLIDSLLQQLPHMKEDTQKVAVLNIISYTFFFINANEGIRYGQQAMVMAEHLKWKRGIATAHKNIGNSYMFSDAASALLHYFKALEIYSEIKDRAGESRTLANIAGIYNDKGDYTRAITYALRALRVNQETGDKAGQSRICSTIGAIYETMGMRWATEALRYDSMALALSIQLNDKQSIAINEGNMGNVYHTLKAYDKSLQYNLRSLKVYEELGDSSAIANKMANLVSNYESLYDFETSLQYNLKALSIYAHLDDKQATGLALAHLGQTYYRIGIDTTNKIKRSNIIPATKNECFRKAVFYLEQAKEIFAANQYINELQSTYELLGEAYALLGDVVNGPKYHNLFTYLKDSFINSDNFVKLANAEKEHEVLQKERQKQLTDLVTQKKRNEQFFFALGGLMLLVIIGLVVRERKRSERLLMNILPAKIAQRLKKKEHPIADHFDNASIMFMDMAGFTKFADKKEPKVVVSVLNDLFTRFDHMAEKHGMEKIKTIGDCYMAVAGLPEKRADHAEAAAAMALDIKTSMKGYTAPDGTPINFRIGLHCGPVVAGVIGKKKFVYDLWGDAVNTASRMESSGLPGEIHISDTFKNNLPDNYVFTDRGILEIKSKGPMQTWLLDAKA